MKIKKFMVLMAALSLILSACSLQKAQAWFGSKNQSLEDAAGEIAKDLVRVYQKNPLGPLDHKPFVHISQNHLVDPKEGNIYPFSKFLCEELRNALGKTGQFKITDDDTFINTDFLLTGTYYREGQKLNILARLIGIAQTRDKKAGKQGNFDAASARTDLKQKYWSKHWFSESAGDRMLFLMHKLESKSFSKLFHECFRKKLTVRVNNLVYENTAAFSTFSAYISPFASDYFTQTDLLTPVGDIQEGDKSRSVVPVPITTKDVTMAAMTNATHYTTGSYWLISQNEIEVKVVLHTAKGQVLASDSIKIASQLMRPDWLHPPLSNDQKTKNDLKVLDAVNPDQQLSVELFTQKGKDNLCFASGEQIIFHLKTNRDAFIRMFNRGPDGKVLQIYPNNYDHGQKVKAHQFITIPNASYDKGFKFKVNPPTGNEVVFLYASDQPLPELPGEKLDYFYGVKSMDFSTRQIHRHYTEYAAARGIFLSKDVISFRTAIDKNFCSGLFNTQEKKHAD